MKFFLTKGLVALTLASFFYGLQGIFMRLIGVDFGVFYPFVIRGLLIAVILFTYLYVTGRLKKIRSSDLKWFALMPASGMAAFITIFIAYSYLSIGSVLLTHFASLTATGFLLGYLFFNEKMNRVKGISLFLSILGLFVMFSSSLEGGNILYFFLAFISGIGASAWYLLSKKISLHYPYGEILAVDSAAVFVLCLILSVLFKENLSLPTLSVEWFSVFALVIVSMAALLFTVYGFRFLQAQVASLLLLLEVLFGLVLAWLFFQEMPNSASLVGGMIILAGIALPNLSFAEKRLD